jgi:hypothetical protein
MEASNGSLIFEFAQDRTRFQLVLSFAMAKSNDMEAEGTMAFPSVPTATYRYVISLQSEKVSIWLEDCRSKKQW